MVYDKLYDSFEESISLYFVNPSVMKDWDSMGLSHNDAMVESSKRETEIAYEILGKLKEKGFERLEDVNPDAKRYLAHLPSFQCLVASEKEYNTLDKSIIDNHVDLSVQGFETLKPYVDAVREGKNKWIPMVEEMNKVLSRTDEVPFLNVQFKVKDKNPIAVMRMSSDIYNTVNELLNENKKSKVFTVLNPYYNNTEYKCFAPGENKNFGIVMFLGYHSFTKDGGLDIDKYDYMNDIACKNSQPVFKHQILTTPHVRGDIVEENTYYPQKTGGQIKVSSITSNRQIAACEFSFALPLESMGSVCKDFVTCVGRVDEKTIKDWGFRQGGFMSEKETDRILKATFINRSKDTVVKEHEVDTRRKKVADLSVEEKKVRSNSKGL